MWVLIDGGAMWISKKKYNEMVAERDKWDRIASEAVAQNGRLLTEIDGAIKEMKEIQELNHQLVEHNDVLLAYTKELEKQRDMWRERAEEENRQAETYRGMLKCAEVG
jgi:16S rRNA U1498 N3-methylase RsmE